MPLPDLSAELLSESLPFKITSEILDRVILARLAMLPALIPTRSSGLSHLPPSHFEYFISSWSRCLEVNRRLSNLLAKVKDKIGGDMESKALERIQTRFNGIKKVKELIVSYAGLIVQNGMEDLVNQDSR